MLKRRIIVISALLLVATIAVVFSSMRVADDMITPERLVELRATYPIIIPEMPSGFDGVFLPLDKVITATENIVYAEVVSIPEKYTVTIEPAAGTPEGAIAEKHGDKGNEIDFVRIGIKIFTDLEGQLAAGSEMTLTYSADVPLPNMEPGSRFVIPVSTAAGKSHEGKYAFSTIGMYYVTDDEYVLSVTDEISKRSFTGKKMDDLFSDFRDLRK